MTGNRHGMGTMEQVIDFEAFLRRQGNAFLIAAMCDGDAHPDTRQIAQSILYSRRRA